MPSFRFLRSGLFALLAFAGIAAVSKATPVAPTNLVVAGFSTPSSGNVADFVLNWWDNSTTETNWWILYSSNGGLSWSGAPVASTTTSTTTASTGYSITSAIIQLAAGQNYLFEVYAYDQSYSASSNIASYTTSVFTISAGLVPNQQAVKLSWSSVPGVTGYDIYVAGAAAGPYSYIGTAAPTATQYQVTSPYVTAGNVYYFKVRPYLGSTWIGLSDAAGLNLDVITSKTGASGTAGSAFLQTFTQTSAYAVTSRSLTWNGSTALPTGLVFNTSTGVLSGYFPPVGNYTLKYTVGLSDGTVLTQNFSIRVRPAAGPPLVGAFIPAWSGAAGTTRDTPLAGTFTDAEAESAVRVSTTLGNMDFVLFDTATPATVANFKNYVSSGRFANVAFHRSVAGFVIQGGGFKGAGAGSSFTSVVTDPPVVNEPGISNLRGTVSMAKLGGDPDSATSQFFVSLADNSANLDYQNAGFTVFGRVAGTGMTVADAIASLPTNTYNLYLDGSTTATPFADFPLNAPTAPAVMDQTKLVKINSVTTIPTLSYNVAGNTSPSVASASIVGGQLHLVGLAGGHTTITVSATNLDNQTNIQTVAVDVSDTFATWSARNTFPGGQSGAEQNPDGDALDNLEEYAFFGNPALPEQNLLPVPGITGVSPAPQYLTLTFPVRKFATGLTYVVEGSDTPGGAWTTVWTSADGFAGAQVVSAVDQPDRTVVTIRDTAAMSSQPMRFLRTRVAQQ